METKIEKTKIKDLVYCRDKVLKEISSKKKKEVEELNKKTKGIV